MGDLDRVAMEGGVREINSQINTVTALSKLTQYKIPELASSWYDDYIVIVLLCNFQSEA